MVTPTLDPKTNGRFGQIDVLAGPDEALYYRVFGRGKEGSKGELRASGPLEKGKPILAFGGGPNMPMTITFQLDKYMPAAIEKRIYEPVVLPKGQMGNGIAACRAEMTVKGETKEVWLSRSENLDPPPSRFVTFADKAYEVVYDVDRRPLGFELKLDDFDMGFEPGTEQPTHYVSQVRLTDASLGIKEQPHTISMNNPLDHRGFTFYQSNYIRMRDPHTGGFTGQFQSIFQVATNPGRPIIYAGCLLVVAGAFLQFYMRAGIFTDGGKKERQRALAKKQAKAKPQPRSRRRKTFRPIVARDILHNANDARRPPGDAMMKRISKQMFGLVLAGAFAACQPARAGEEQKSPGTGPAYDLIGKVAVLHAGRIKPLDTVAREEVKQIYGRETIKLHDPADEIDKILDPAAAARKTARATRRELGPGGCVHRLEHRPGILGRTAVHSGGLSAAAAHAHGRCDRDAPQGDRRKVDHLRRREGSIAKARVGARAGLCRRLPPLSAARSCRSKTAGASPSWPRSSRKSTNG